MSKRNKNVLHFSHQDDFYNKREQVMEHLINKYHVIEKMYSRVIVKVNGMTIHIQLFEVNSRDYYNCRVRVVVSDQTPNERKWRGTSSHQKSFSEGEGTGRPILSLNKVFKYVDKLAKKLRVQEEENLKNEKMEAMKQMTYRTLISRQLKNAQIVVRYGELYEIKDSDFMRFRVNDDNSITATTNTFHCKLNENTSEMILELQDVLKRLEEANAEANVN
jgi:hypothetical protein